MDTNGGRIQQPETVLQDAVYLKFQVCVAPGIDRVRCFRDAWRACFERSPEIIWKMEIAFFLETSRLRDRRVEGKSVEKRYRFIAKKRPMLAESESERGERWKCWTEENNKKEEGETVVASTARGTEIRGERKRKIYGATRCRLTTGSVRLPTKPLLHAISSTILTRVLPFTLRSLERPPSSSLWLLRSLVRLFARPRCTVAFGLCIIITVTASSSWLVEESPCLCSLCHYPVDVVLSHRIGYSCETGHVRYERPFDSRVRVN